MWFHRSGTQYTGTVHDVNESKGTAVYTYQSKCSRCGGAGGAEQWKYTGWTCYDCGGSGLGSIRDEKVYTAEKLAKLDAAQAKRDAKRAAEAEAERKAFQQAADAKRAGFLAAHGELLEAMKAYPADSFLSDLVAKADKWGELTAGQIEAAQKAIARHQERAQKAAASAWVGTVGERIELTVTLEHAIDLAYDADGEPKPREFGDFRPPVIYLFRDGAGNRIVYKGQPYFADIFVKFEQGEACSVKPTVTRKGETITFRATVKAHEERNGEKQTIVARPKLPAAPAVGEQVSGTDNREVPEAESVGF